MERSQERWFGRGNGRICFVFSSRERVVLSKIRVLRNSEITRYKEKRTGYAYSFFAFPRVRVGKCLIGQKDKKFARPVNRRFKASRWPLRRRGDCERGIASSVKREASKQDRIERAAAAGSVEERQVRGARTGSFAKNFNLSRTLPYPAAGISPPTWLDNACAHALFQRNEIAARVGVNVLWNYEFLREFNRRFARRLRQVRRGWRKKFYFLRVRVCAGRS